MKKITLLIAFIATTFTYAQKVYDFTGSQNPGNWIQAGNGSSVTTSAAGLVFEFVAGTPRIDIGRAIDPFVVTAGSYMLVTLINNNTEVGSFSGFYDKNTVGQTGTNFVGFQAGMVKASAPGAGVERTYVFDLSNAAYINDPGNMTGNDTDNTANMEYIGIRFRNATGAVLAGTSAANGNIILKRIEIVNLGVEAKTDFNFAANNFGIPGFSGTNGTVTDGNTTLDWASDNSNAAPKFSQTFYKVDASANTYVHALISSNASNADQLKFQFVDATSATQTYGNQAINIGSASVFTQSLTSKPTWTGDIKDWRLTFSVAAGGNVNTGAVKISRIYFDNNATLGTEDFESLSSFSLYPNPASNTLNISSTKNVASVAIYNMLGQNVASQAGGNEVNVSGLNAGIYVAKVTLENGGVVVERFIKE